MWHSTWLACCCARMTVFAVSAQHDRRGGCGSGVSSSAISVSWVVGPSASLSPRLYEAPQPEISWACCAERKSLHGWWLSKSVGCWPCVWLLAVIQYHLIHATVSPVDPHVLCAWSFWVRLHAARVRGCAQVLAPQDAWGTVKPTGDRPSGGKRRERGRAGRVCACSFVRTRWVHTHAHSRR